MIMAMNHPVLLGSTNSIKFAEFKPPRMYDINQIYQFFAPDFLIFSFCQLIVFEILFE